jgi:hypothetical protein
MVPAACSPLPRSASPASPSATRYPARLCLTLHAFDHLAGPRYLPGFTGAFAATLVAANVDGRCALVAAGLGVALLCVNDTTLAQLAAAHASTIPRHTRHGIVADCALPSWGDLRGAYPICGESDGLWSGMVLASLCFQYAVTHDPVVRDLAWELFAGLELLNR